MPEQCQKCASQLSVGAKFCPRCGTAVMPATVGAPPLPSRVQPPTHPATQPAYQPARHRPEPSQGPVFYKNPGLAALLSFFFMGAGQIYNGEIGKGIVFLIMYLFSLLLMFVLIGFITTPILWIWGMVDAHGSAKRINEQLAAANPGRDRAW